MWPLPTRQATNPISVQASPAPVTGWQRKAQHRIWRAIEGLGGGME